MERMRRKRARISHHDSARRLAEAGVDLFLGEGRFTSPETVEVGGRTLRFNRAVIATGAGPRTPDVPGLEEAGFLTNENIFELTERPPRLVVFGAGPLGCELAQTFQRLGSDVTIVEQKAHLLVKEDRDAAEILQEAFRRDGVTVQPNTKAVRVNTEGGRKFVHVETEGRQDVLEADEILVGAGRVPNVAGLNLEAAGVEYWRHGVRVNDRLQTSNKRIFAAGDICLRYKFTHTAEASARLVLRNALFYGRGKKSALTIPWCTYTDPEIAHVGMYEEDAREQGIPVETLIRRFDEVDRAITDGDEEGFVKVHLREGSDQILGATIVARHAGEMISEITTAMVGGVGLKTIWNVIHPYPTHAEAIKHVADEFNRRRLSPWVKGLFERFLAWRR
jgi:pyruvate/2-oxoglutarate dehydrogenase complex dihydrolipoamide dehydrogenase (E3) component